MHQRMLQNLLFELSLPFHEMCLQLAPSSHHQLLYSALVCGSNLQNDSFSEALRSTSLLHIAIVSGSHLVLLESILRWLLPKQLSQFKSIFFLLLIFCLMTAWQPPAVRSLLTLLLQKLNQNYRLNWNGLQLTFFAGISTWCFFPQWYFSYSFLLSWGASLALCLVPQVAQLKFHQQWQVHLSVYVLLMPLLIPFGGSHPFSVLCNWWIGPLFSFLLFPLSLVAFLIPPLTLVTDFMWSLSVQFISFIGAYVPQPDLSVETPISLLWFYLFFIQFLFHFIQLKKKRQYS